MSLTSASTTRFRLAELVAVVGGAMLAVASVVQLFNLAGPDLFRSPLTLALGALQIASVFIYRVSKILLFVTRE